MQPPGFPNAAPYNPPMPVSTAQSLRRLLLTHETALVALVVLSAGLGVSWGWVWQGWSKETIRLNYLEHTALEIRSQVFRHIQAVSVAALREEEDVLSQHSAHVRGIQERFNALRRNSTNRGEDYAIQDLQTAFSLLQTDLRATLGDSFQLNRLVRAKLLDPAFEREFVADFDAAFAHLAGLIDLSLQQQEKRIARWRRLAPFALAVIAAVGIALLVFSRSSLRRGFVEPMQRIMAGTREISSGRLDHSLPLSGVAEVRELAAGINRMAGDLEESRAAVVSSTRQAAQGALVPVVAHNIRNPLAAIRANAQLLDGADSGAEVAETRSAIIDTVDRLERWVSALVSYLHPLEPKRRPLSAVGVLEAAAGLLEARLVEGGIRIEAGPCDPDARIDADPDLMEQAVYGLINNALEASVRGQVIRYEVRRDAGHVQMIIADEAGGVPFQPQPSGLTPGPSDKRFGTGLGIPVAFKICDSHGFDLNFEIEAGQGTRVVITALESGAQDPADKDGTEA